MLFIAASDGKQNRRKEGGSSGGGSGSEGGDAKPRVSSTGGLLQAMSDGWNNPNMASQNATNQISNEVSAMDPGKMGAVGAISAFGAQGLAKLGDIGQSLGNMAHDAADGKSIGSSEAAFNKASDAQTSAAENKDEKADSTDTPRESGAKELSGDNEDREKKGSKF